MLGISRRTFLRWADDLGIKPVQFNRKHMYRIVDVAWMRRQKNT
jgi:hypothetical protein